MNTLLDKLNLTPQERRWVVGALLAVFVVLNFMLVWPHFKDLGQVREELGQARKKLAEYQQAADTLPALTNRFAKLEGAANPLPSTEQSLQLERTIRAQARASNLNIADYRQSQVRHTGARVSELIEEQVVSLVVDSGDKELVDFLVNLGSGNSVIRVRDMTLKPDATQLRLVGSLTLVASYQKASSAKDKSTAAASK